MPSEILSVAEPRLSYAEVCVNSPAGREQLFSYSIPPELDIRPGHAVWVPFGNRTLQGIVISLSRYPAIETVRPIYRLLEPEPVLSPVQIALAQWLSDYYLAPLFSCVACCLPPGFERQALTFISATGQAEILTPPQQKVLALAGAGRVSLKSLAKALGSREAQRAVAYLAGRNLIARTYEMEPVKVKPRSEPVVCLTSPQDKVMEAAFRLRKKAKKQAALLEHLLHQGGPVPLMSLAQAGFSRPVINNLVKQGLLTLSEVEVARRPIDYQTITPSAPLSLTPAQQQALESISRSLGSGKPEVFLLHGVTGAGKTEVYLQALDRAIRLGKQAIALVPEIALTPQTIERFASRFPGGVAVLHSQLTLGEQYDEWRQIKAGRYDVVIGARSAVFAPLPHLGLIVVDEEHEWSYKQQEQAPRYHARMAALKLAELSGATVVLGSATPDVESYYRATTGDYHLLKLPERLTPRPGAPMPAVEVVDLRQELKSGNRSIFSTSLSEGIKQAMARQEQVILFCNRRGAASSVQCRSCGKVLACPRCQVALSYHTEGETLVCHHCNRRQPVPSTCPACGSRRIKFLGLGTQKLYAETAQTFPQARLLRWDSDAARSRREHEAILNKLRTRQADILIGTQMVAKGLDLPGITLIGVVSADTALNLPDFRAGERTFQLLSQVAGRAGRGEQPGKVIIQTYSPEHNAIKAASGYAYTAFYEQEIELRRQLLLPPFSQLIQLTYSHANEATARHEAERLQRELEDTLAGKGIVDISLIGPAPAFLARLRGRSRWQLILKGREPARLLKAVELPQGWVVDVDPLGLS